MFCFSYSTTNFPGGAVWVVGDTITVKYQANGAVTTGSFVSFGFDRYNSATTNSEFCARDSKY